MCIKANLPWNKVYSICFCPLWPLKGGGVRGFGYPKTWWVLKSFARFCSYPPIRSCAFRGWQHQGTPQVIWRKILDCQDPESDLALPEAGVLAAEPIVSANSVLIICLKHGRIHIQQPLVSSCTTIVAPLCSEGNSLHLFCYGYPQLRSSLSTSTQHGHTWTCM